MISTLSRRVPRPSIALVVAFVALFAALGGTGYAALTITGKNIQNETVTGADVDNKSLSYKELKKDTLGGDQINESKLGTVPDAAHAANADNAVNAQTAAKATDADTLGGLPASEFMRDVPRAFESHIAETVNFPTNTTLGTLTDIAPGTYVITAKLGYHNPGVAGEETCELEVPGGDDTASFTVLSGATEQIMLQEVVTSDSLFMATVHCTSDGGDDTHGLGNIIAVRVD
jgi:hypothetical protein